MPQKALGNRYSAVFSPQVALAFSQEINHDLIIMRYQRAGQNIKGRKMELPQIWIWNVWGFIGSNGYVASFGIVVVLIWVRLGRIIRGLKQLNGQVLKVGRIVRELEDLNGRTASRFRPLEILEQGLEKPLMAPSDPPPRAAHPTAATKFKGVSNKRQPTEAIGDLRQVRL